MHEQCDPIGDMYGGMVVRTAVAPATIISAVRQAIWSIDKNPPIARKGQNGKQSGQFSDG